ncbi:glycosyltransferase [Bradyrhizobium lablabi]|uniref:glycosyltransferase n=1 Tax=Bradyrhizobium lablabi TaxID=722472 RepID=UPI001BA4F41C|nr:glycosyltransferase [Bradyrhizobium lablabi]MBR0697931.1 glycosyltransferase family 4 protein [Bradyrhizobium lablabi]
MNKILWIAGRVPSPLFSGDALYSAGMLTALSRTERAAVTVIGTRRGSGPIEDRLLRLPRTTFPEPPLPRRHGILSLFTSLPRDAYSLAPPSIGAALAELLKQRWDWIVFDHARSAAFLPMVLQQRKQASICYVAHNAEGKIRPEIAKDFANPLRRSIMRWDAEKYRRLEQSLVEAADSIVCITDADAAHFARSGKTTFVVPPIYLGTIAPGDRIGPDRPRSILLLGSFEWVAKQRNLEHIIGALLPVLKSKDVTLDVVGNVPEDIKARYAHERPRLVFHGPVADLSGVLAKSRGGLVAETLGGGFKLKLLDYAFARLPIFGLRTAVDGTTADEQSAMYLADTMEGLANAIIGGVDDLASLNRNQARLFELMSHRFGLEQGTRRLRDILLQKTEMTS